MCQYVHVDGDSDHLALRRHDGVGRSLSPRPALPLHIMKISFGLKKKTEAPAPSIPKPKPVLFDDAETEEPAVPTSVAYNVEASKAMQKRMEAEMQVDSTVFEYDEVWDRMQIAKQKAKEAKELESAERKVWLVTCSPCAQC